MSTRVGAVRLAQELRSFGRPLVDVLCGGHSEGPALVQILCDALWKPPCVFPKSQMGKVCLQ